MKNRTFIGVICIVLAVLTTFVVSPMVNKMSEGKAAVVRFTKDIAQGAQITEDDIEVVNLVKSSLPENFIPDKTAVIGMFANADLYKGDIATDAKLTADANASINILGALTGDKVAMSVTIASFARGLSAKLQNGDIVSIYVTDKEGNTETPPTLKYVRVITTTTAGGVDENEVEPNEDGTFDLPTTITVLVSVAQAQELAVQIELFTTGSHNTFAQQTNVNIKNRFVCFDILDLGSQMMPIGMLTVLDSILNRITANRAAGKETYIFIDEIYLLFQHEYSANFLFTLWKRIRKYNGFCTGITQNVDDLLQSHTARTMLANSEFIIMLNQGSTDRDELAKLLQISDDQMKHITNVDSGHGLIKVGSDLVPFERKFPKDTKLYKLMTTKISDLQ